MSNYAQDKYIRITISTPDGEVLDMFPVAHWSVETLPGVDPDDSDLEGVHSRASEALLMERIRRYVRQDASE